MSKLSPDSSKFFRFIATPSWRGISMLNLMSELQESQFRLNNPKSEFAQHFDAMLKSYGYQTDALDSLPTEFWQFRIEGILHELRRREEIKTKYGTPAHPYVIQAIKEAIPIADVLEKYTEVYLYQGKWTFRCRLHGEDKIPSGVIYPDEKRWWCFGCSTGGDVVDALQVYGRMDIRQAIRELCAMAGLEPQLVPQKPKENQEPKVIDAV